MEKLIFNAETPRRRVYLTHFSVSYLFASLCLSLCLCVSALNSPAQTETAPAPGPPKSGTIPAVQEKKLSNGLTVAVVERKSVPLVTIQLLVKAGASSEGASKAGLADLTASMLTKGTKTRSATQIAEDIEFLGGSINSGAGWNSSFVSITVTSDKVDQAMAILADVVLNPKFDQKELDLLKSQTLDGLTFNLKQPSFLANYVASKYSFGEHPAGGTRSSISSISADDIVAFKQENYFPDHAIVIFAGDISPAAASIVTNKSFAAWKNPKIEPDSPNLLLPPSNKPRESDVVKRVLVIDLPDSGQAAVSYAKKLDDGRVICPSPPVCSVQKDFYPAVVTNAVLGGGYSARLNYEIRIKRGLSYGAGSNVSWRDGNGNFGTRAQTKNESAPEVAELTLAEIEKLAKISVTKDEMTPRKSVLTGNFGRNLETTGGLAGAVAELFSFQIPTAELNSYVRNVTGVADRQILDFSANNLLGGDIIIVGDYSVFKDDLAKRFPNMKIDVIKADELDLTKDNLRK